MQMLNFRNRVFFFYTESSKFIEERPSGLLNILITAPYGGDNMLASITPAVSDRHDGCYDAGTDTCVYDVGCAPQDAVQYVYTIN